MWWLKLNVFVHPLSGLRPVTSLARSSFSNFVFGPELHFFSQKRLIKETKSKTLCTLSFLAGWQPIICIPVVGTQKPRVLLNVWIQGTKESKKKKKPRNQWLKNLTIDFGNGRWFIVVELAKIMCIISAIFRHISSIRNTIILYIACISCITYMVLKNVRRYLKYTST